MPNVTERLANLTDSNLFASPTATTLDDSATLTRKWLVDVLSEEPHLSITSTEPGGRLPEWVEPLVERLVSLLRLPPNWDSYGARPVSMERVGDVIDILARIMSDKTMLPWLVPTSDGGIQIEWQRDETGIEIEIGGDGNVSVFCHEATSGREWEGGLAQHVDPVRRILDESMSVG